MDLEPTIALLLDRSVKNPGSYVAAKILPHEFTNLNVPKGIHHPAHHHPVRLSACSSPPHTPRPDFAETSVTPDFLITENDI